MRDDNKASARDWPQWAVELAELPILTIKEAAHALAGTDPCALVWVPDEVQKAAAKWEALLRRSVSAGLLPGRTCEDARGCDVKAILPADLAAWCANRPVPVAYPLPDPRARSYSAPSSEPRAATDTAQMLAESETARERLAAELASLKDAHALALHRLKERERLAAEIQQPCAAPTKEPEGKGNVEKPLDPRERSTLLVIVAALAAEAGVNWRQPYAAAVTIQSKAAELGATVSEKAVASHLMKVQGVLMRRCSMK